MATSPFPLRRVALVLLGVAVAWGFATCTLEVLGMKPVKTIVEREGKYELRYATYDAFGHRGTRVDVYWVGNGRRAALVGKNVGRRIFAPGDSSRLLFEHCPTTVGGKGPCGAYVWDARTRTTRRVSSVYPIIGFPSPEPWAPDARSVALVHQDGGEVIHLESGRTTDLASLRLDLPVRGIATATWRRDGRLVVTVVQYPSRDGPFVHGARHPYLVDPATGSVTSLDASP